jgi:large exoprotein involved in heme utilization and adhesion
VVIDVVRLVPTGASIALGGDVELTFEPGVFGFNVIQAAAPDGVQGDIAITAPELDLSSTLGGLGSTLLDAGGPARDPCGDTGSSSVSWTGRGGLPASVGKRSSAVLTSASVYDDGVPRSTQLAMAEGCDR